jgi:metabolite-proton symporter
MRRVALSVLIGTTIEWYDFLIYGAAAALVFAPLFFPSADPVAGTLLAFSTFAVGFGARPLGGIVLGHFGDRLGRKKMLVLSLTMMGLATFVIGVLPTYDRIGVWAPILLVLMRLLQGFGVGGEWGGAVLTAVEYASPGKRGLYGSLPQIGVPAGLFLSSIAFLAVSRLDEKQFLSWGWRVPFLISLVLVMIGLFVRLKLTETPAFERVKSERTEVRLPLITAFSTYPKQILLAIGSMISTGGYFYVVNTYAITYGTTTGAFTRNEMLVAVLISAVVAVVCLPYFGSMSQRRGRRKMILLGLAAMAVWIFPTFLAVESGNLPLLIVVYAVGAAFFSVSYGPQATFIAELFDARVRFSAASTSFQVGVLLGGAMAPIVAAALVAATGSSMSVAVYVAVLSLISFVSVLAVKQSAVDRGSADLDAAHAGTAEVVQGAQRATA